jgi:hypothetical protein
MRLLRVIVSSVFNFIDDLDNLQCEGLNGFVDTFKCRKYR